MTDICCGCCQNYKMCPLRNSISNLDIEHDFINRKIIIRDIQDLIGKNCGYFHHIT